MIIQKPIEFKVVSAQSLPDLESVVNTMIAQDWTLHGDWKMTGNRDQPTFCQALARMGFMQVNTNGGPGGTGLLIPR